MILTDVLRALSVNDRLNVTLLSPSETPMITFNAPGYGSIEDDLGERTVHEIRVKAGNVVELLIGDMVADPDPGTGGGD